MLNVAVFSSAPLLSDESANGSIHSGRSLSKNDRSGMKPRSREDLPAVKELRNIANFCG